MSLSHMNEKKVIIVSDNRVWAEIQSSFSEHYPFLKIVYRENGYRRNTTDADPSITQSSFVNQACIIDISSNRTVLEILYDFKTMLGLELQVSRKSGNVWNIISITEDWTLGNQNAEGEFISSQPAIPINKKPID